MNENTNLTADTNTNITNTTTTVSSKVYEFIASCKVGDTFINKDIQDIYNLHEKTDSGRIAATLTKAWQHGLLKAIGKETSPKGGVCIRYEVLNNDLSAIQFRKQFSDGLTSPRPRNSHKNKDPHKIANLPLVGNFEKEIEKALEAEMEELKEVTTHVKPSTSSHELAKNMLVAKKNGHLFPGKIVATYKSLDGTPHVVVECTFGPAKGLQHIYRESQIRRLREDERTKLELIDKLWEL